MKNKKRALVNSVISLLLCLSMFVSTTFAWFTDEVTSGGNIITSGNLDATMEYATAPDGQWQDASEGTIFGYEFWEPGYTDMKFIRVGNIGNLAFRYQLHIIPAEATPEGEANLADVIDVYCGVVDENFVAPTDFSENMPGMTKMGTLSELLGKTGGAASGVLLPNSGAVDVKLNPEDELIAETGSSTMCILLHMQETAGNEYQNLDVGGYFQLRLLATQYTYENDSFGNDYDTDSEFPTQISENVSADVTVENNAVKDTVTILGTSTSAEIPAGVQVAEGTEKLTLTVTDMESTESNVVLGENEDMRSLNVHVEGVAENNTVPMIITIEKAMAHGLNAGNYRLIHVENGMDVAMTPVASLAEVDAHNEFYYDPATGDVTMALATFSEVAAIANIDNPWNGNYNYSWYDAAKASLVIANADQLAGFGAIVGGMDGKTQDSFSGKTVKLIANINIGDTISDNGKVFYPIGYYNSNGNYNKVSGGSVTSGFKTFEGIFDGNGHTIANFYQNTWEMFGDYNDGYTGTPNHYRDGMGLFGKVYGGTVKNLTVKNFSSDGEFTTTGTIAAYADCGATFENIAIFNCNPRVYNIGNGGIVGCVGWYASTESANKVTFRNITVDNTNKISALWGSWDVACGGLVGQYYPTSGQTPAVSNAGIHMENCHVAAQIDVNNDVCANYQYYAYRYAGILIGSVRENVEQNGHVYPNMNGITASGCTVHFGDWNDYYYCELVANSLASYTHDHQMSRLTQVKEVNGTSITYLDGTTGTVPSSGRYNYVVVDGAHATENATCYHFVDGAVWNHADAGEETVDGKTVLKEDKQHLYLEFNNLVTGYGWGVTSKGVGEMDGVTILDRDEGYSVQKFEVQDTISHEYRCNNERAIGKFFKAATITDPNLSIKNDQVQVTVSPKPGTDSTAGCIYTPNATDWTRGTLKFTGKGAAVITITDYYYCTSTSVEVVVVENRVTGISAQPKKNVYDISLGETFKDGDVVVTAVFSDGSASVLDVSEYTYAFKEGADSDFTSFGQKTATVTFTYAEDTVTTEFVVFAVNMKELTLAGAPEVEGEQRIQRYFQQFGINGVGQSFFTAAGRPADENDINIYGTAETLEFATGTVDYTINSHAGNATFDETDKNGQLTINCTTAPFADIFGYVGYADRVPIAFGVYVDSIDNLTYTIPMEANADIIKLAGTQNARIFYIQAPLNKMNLSAGEHKVHFVSIFDDGIQPLTTWTVNVQEKEEIDISAKTANVIILAGQSNAYGASALTDLVKGVAAGVDYSNIFINYSNINCENGQWKSLFYNSGFEPYHPGVGGTVNGLCFGPEVGIAYQLATNKATKDEVWYIIKYTAAGSMLDGQWLEGTYDNEGLVQDMGGYLSDLMVDYVENALAKITQIHGDNINVHSFVWMQGESDALAPDCAQKYQANEAALVNKVRTSFAQYAKNGNGDNIVFVSGGIAKFADITRPSTGVTTSNGWEYSDTVNNGKKANTKIEWNPVAAENGGYLNVDTSYKLANSAWIDTSSLLVGAAADENDDVYHYSSISMWNLGTWFGTAINYVASLIQ